MKKLIVLNHKMNLEYDDIYPYINRLNQIDTHNDLIVCPSSLYLTDFVNYCQWGVGVQNVSQFSCGEYTGEVSSLQVKSLGVEYALIGHYERRKYFYETDEDVHQKLIACLESNIIPIVCFGETGKKEDIIHSLDIILKDVINQEFIIFAYEPLKVQYKENIDTIREQIHFIQDYLYDRYHTLPNIIYGGGIGQKDISSILKINGLNGLLIGKLSSQIDKIIKVIEMADE